MMTHKCTFKPVIVDDKTHAVTYGRCNCGLTTEGINPTKAPKMDPYSSEGMQHELFQLKRGVGELQMVNRKWRRLKRKERRASKRAVKRSARRAKRFLRKENRAAKKRVRREEKAARKAAAAEERHCTQNNC